MHWKQGSCYPNYSSLDKLQILKSLRAYHLHVKGVNLPLVPIVGEAGGLALGGASPRTV